MAKSSARRDDNYVPVALGVNESGETKELQLTDTTLRLKVDSNSGDGVSSIGASRTVVSSAGTPIQLPDVDCKKVYIQCSEANGSLTNGGIIVVGDSSVDATLATRIGFALYPTQTQAFNVSNLSLLYVDSLDDGAAIQLYYEI